MLLVGCPDGGPGHNSELRWRQHLPHRVFTQQLFSAFGQRNAALDSLTQTLRAVGAERHPEFEGARSAGQFQASIPQVNFAGPRLDVQEILRIHRVGLFEYPAATDQQASNVMWLKEPLVRVEDEGIGVLDAREGVAARLKQGRWATVGCVDVKPQAFLPA